MANISCNSCGSIKQRKLLKKIQKNYTTLLEEKSGMTCFKLRRWNEKSDNTEYFDFDADHRVQYTEFMIRANIQATMEKGFDMKEQGIIQMGEFTGYTYSSTGIIEGDELQFRGEWFKVTSLNTGMLGDGSREITSFSLEERR